MNQSARVDAEVLAQTTESPGYCRLRLLAPHIAATARPGQFVHVLTRSASSHDPMLRRAFSVLSVNQNEIELLYRVQGRGTQLMSVWQAGVVVDLLGPMGRGFSPLPDQPLRAILVGGGIGVPPLAMLASTRTENQDVLALVGARGRNDVLCERDFARHGVKVCIATDDGSVGCHGLVTDLLRDELTTNSKTVVFTCGPWPMLRAVASICDEFKVSCQVSLEEAMPCGVGICNGCVVAVKDSSSDYDRFRRVCVEGPVMDGHDIAWGGEYK